MGNYGTISWFHFLKGKQDNSLNCKYLEVGNKQHILSTKNSSCLPTQGERDKLQIYIQRQKVLCVVKRSSEKIKEVIH